MRHRKSRVLPSKLSLSRSAHAILFPKKHLIYIIASSKSQLQQVFQTNSVLCAVFPVYSCEELPVSQPLPYGISYRRESANGAGNSNVLANLLKEYPKTN